MRNNSGYDENTEYKSDSGPSTGREKKNQRYGDNDDFFRRYEDGSNGQH